MIFRGIALAAMLALPSLCGSAGSDDSLQKVLSLFAQLRQAEVAKAQGRPANRVKFALPQDDVNTYLVEALRVLPRPGVKSMTLKFFPKNYVSTLATVDFDEVERARPGMIPKMLRPVLTGRKTVWVDIRFQVQNSRATFDVEKAYFENVPLPALVVQKVIETVAARQPERYDATKPIPLPFSLSNVWTQAGVISGEN